MIFQHLYENMELYSLSRGSESWENVLIFNYLPTIRRNVLGQEITKIILIFFLHQVY